MARRPYLVMVRAGAASLHSHWLADDPDRNWDCWVSWYCEPAGRSAVAVEYESDGGDNKFEGYIQGRDALALNLDAYRYVALLDDDLEFPPGGISQTFSQCARVQADLAQPALRWGSNVNHDVTLHNPLTDVRRVSFVEVMMPFFSKDALHFLEPSFLLSKSSWGIDYAWGAQLAHRPGGSGKLVIIDAVQVHHTKPFDTKQGAFYRKLAAMGVDAAAEYGRIKASSPSFGGLRSLKSGHVGAGFWRLLPTPLLDMVVRLGESIKKRRHRRLNALSGGHA